MFLKGVPIDVSKSPNIPPYSKNKNEESYTVSVSQTPEPPAHLLVFDKYKDMSVMLTPNEKNVQHVCWCIIKYCLFGGRFPSSVFVLIFPHLCFFGRNFPTCFMFTSYFEKVAIWTHLGSFVFVFFFHGYGSKRVVFPVQNHRNGRLFYRGSAVFFPRRYTHTHPKT